MSYKLGFLLSMVFFFQVILFGIDLIAFQNIITKLDLVATTSKSLVLRDGNFIAASDYIKNAINGDLICIENCTGIVKNQLIVYRVEIEYKPIFMSVSGSKKKLSSTRALIIPN